MGKIIQGKVNTTKGILPLEYIFTAVLLLVQIFMVYNAYFFTGWDSEVMLENAESLATGQGYMYPEYFALYPNNIFLMYVFAGIKMVVKLFTDDWATGLRVILYVQCALNVLAGLLIFKTVEALRDRKSAWFGYVFYVVLIGTSPWMLIAYSDSFGVILPIFMFYLWVKLSEERNKDVIIYSVLLGITAGMAYSIKPQPVIVFIAIVLIELIYDIASKKSVFRLLLTIACFVLMHFVIKTATYTLNDNVEKNQGVSFTHYLVLGANEETLGGYTGDDLELTYEYSGTERTVAEIKEYFSRVGNMGLVGYTAFLGKKIAKGLGDGSFGWPAATVNNQNVNQYFFRGYSEEPLGAISHGIRAILYGENAGNSLARLIRNVIWYIVLMLVLGGIPAIKKDLKKAVLYLSIVGYVVYVMLFESGARYVFTLAPIFIVTACLTIYDVPDFLELLKKKDSQKVLSDKKTK